MHWQRLSNTARWNEPHQGKWSDTHENYRQRLAVRRASSGPVTGGAGISVLVGTLLHAVAGSHADGRAARRFAVDFGGYRSAGGHQARLGCRRDRVWFAGLRFRDEYGEA